MAPGWPPSRIVNAHAVAGGPQVSWHTAVGKAPSGPGVASGLESGRDSLASKAQVQSVGATGRPHPWLAITTPPVPSPPAERGSRAPKPSAQRRAVAKRVREAPARTPGAYQKPLGSLRHGNPSG